MFFPIFSNFLLQLITHKFSLCIDFLIDVFVIVSGCLDMSPIHKDISGVNQTSIETELTGEPRGFSGVAAGFSSYDGEFRMPLVLAQGSPIFHSSCEGKLGIALE